MTKNLKKKLKTFYKKNTALSVVILFALIIGLPVVAYNSFDEDVKDRIADKYLELKIGTGEIVLGAITLDKSRFDHGIEIVGEGLDVTGAADFNSAFNVDGAATFTSTVDVTGESTLGRLHYGGTVTNASTTLTIARALTAAEVCDSSVITVNSAAVDATVSAASLDITLPSTTTLWADCLESDGDQVRFWFLNLSPTAATTTQIVAGTGMDLLEPDDSSDHDVEIAGGARALIEITRVDGMETGTLDAIATVVDFSAAD